MNTKQLGGKPLKRLWRFFVSAHRAEPAVLMRLRASLQDRRWAPAVAVMCLALVRETALPAAETAPTNAFTLETLVADTLANNPELNFYKAEVAVAKGE